MFNSQNHCVYTGMYVMYTAWSMSVLFTILTFDRSDNETKYTDNKI